jgi:hypothetical protein
MKILITYLIWTFISSLFLKSGLQSLLDTSIGYFPIIMITMFLHLTVVLPLVSVISTATKQQ